MSARILALVGVSALLAVACGGSERDPTVAVGGNLVATTTATISAPPPTMDPFATPTTPPTPDVSATVAASGCAMTPYSGEHPANLNPGFSIGDVNWYHAGELWAQPASYQGNWYAGGMVVFWLYEPGATLSVSGHRLDAAGAAMTVGARIDDPAGSDMNLMIPDAGCWELTGRTATSMLTFTINVLPLEARPEVQELVREHQAWIPYPPPATCPVSPIMGPTARYTDSTFYAQFEYSIEGDGLSVRGTPDLLVEGENALAWFPETWADVTISGNVVGNPGVSLRSTGIRSADQRGEFWRSTVLFPAPGCWALRATAGPQTLDATVYVYPATCAHGIGTPTPSACAPK